MKKTALEHFQDIKELEVADEQGLTVENLLPYKCKQVEKYLKALEIIKEKNVNVYWFKMELTLRNISYRYYVNNFGSFHNGLVVKLLDEEEFNLLKEVLE